MKDAFIKIVTVQNDGTNREQAEIITAGSYEKTDFGFKIQEDFINKYVNKSIQTLLDGVTANCTLNIYVSGGKVGKLESSTQISSSEDGISSNNRETLIFKDFGTTQVETPEGIQSVI